MAVIGKTNAAMKSELRHCTLGDSITRQRE
jgi:hypothetical protein